LNWKSLIFPIVAILVVVFLSDYFGFIGFIIGIIVAILIFIIPFLLGAVFPVLLEYSLKPRVGLQIKDIRLVKRSSHNVEGHQLKALITNNGKKICLNLEATKIQVRDAQGRSPNLLHVDIDDSGAQTEVTSREETAKEVGYAWIDQKGQTIQGVLKELRRKDNVSLLFPYETTFTGRVENLNRSSYSSSERWLKLETDAKYQVVLEVKGEDSDKVTAMTSKKAKIRPE
jgi:hypothetical protein